MLQFKLFFIFALLFAIVSVHARRGEEEEGEEGVEGTKVGGYFYLDENDHDHIYYCIGSKEYHDAIERDREVSSKAFAGCEKLVWDEILPESLKSLRKKMMKRSRF